MTDKDIRSKAQAIGLKARKIVPGTDGRWSFSGCFCGMGHSIQTNESAFRLLEDFERALADDAKGKDEAWLNLHGFTGKEQSNDARPRRRRTCPADRGRTPRA